MTRALSLLVLLTIAGCGSRAAPSPAPPSSAADDADAPDVATARASGFEGTIRVPDEDAKTKGKQFKGAWLERDGGERWVIDYAPDSPYRVLRDRRVRVEGEPYQPKDQALVAKHFHVRTLVVVGKDTADAPLVRVGDKKRLRGRFSEITYPPGSKLAGEKARVFIDADDKTYHLEHVPDAAPPLEAPLAIEAHEVEPSPHVARVGGPYLWVLAVETETH